MAHSSPLIAYGVIHLDGGQTNLPIFVHHDGVRTQKGAEPGKFFDQITKRVAVTKGTGHLIFTNLPIDSRGVSFPATLEYNRDQMTLTVEQSQTTFGELPNAHFEQLRVVIRETPAPNPSFSFPEARAVLNLMEQALPLRGIFDSRGLVFDLEPPSANLTLPNIGVASLNKIDIFTDNNRWNSIQLLYNFGENDKKVVYDNSGLSPAHNLAIKNADPIRGGGLKIRATSEAQTPSNINKLVSVIDSENAFTIDLWIKPTEAVTNQNGSILAIGEDATDRIFLEVKQNRGRVQVTGSFTSANQPIQSPALKQNEPTHIVFTHAKDGKEQLFINDAPPITRNSHAHINSINRNVVLALGSTPKLKNRWKGELHRLAIYDRALTKEEVPQYLRPTINMGGNFTIAKGPEPLDVPLSATFDLVTPEPTVDVNEQKEMAVRPELHFSNLQLHYKMVGPKKWELSGGVDATFWKNKVALNAALVGSTANPLLEFTQRQSPVVIGLDDWGRLEFTEIKLKAVGGQNSKWDLTTTSESPFVILPSLRFRAFDLFADFLLEKYGLGLTAEHLILNGNWLNQDLAFHASRTAGRLFMHAASDFNMLFDVDIPPIQDPETGVTVYDGSQLRNQTMNIDLGLKLSRDGLLAEVGSNFKWLDQDGLFQETTIPVFTLYTPPPNKNAILGHILEELEVNINELFEATGKQLAEYKLEIKGDQPSISLVSSSQTAVRETIVPKLLAADETIASTKRIFQLIQTGDVCKLMINPLGMSQSDIDSDFVSLVDGLARASVGLGGISLVKRRIAERLPIPYDRLLFYYYGLNANEKLSFIDLQSGMRLRIDFQNYQFVQASDQSAKRGFVGAGSTYVQLGDYTRKLANGNFEQLLGIDPFLSQLQTEGAVDAANDGAGGLFDLLRAENRKAAYRLFFPLNPTSGSGPERVATIVGADSIQEMNEATANFTGNANTPPASGTSFFFREKASITPEIQVFVRDQAIYVPIGTTLRQLIQRFDDLPRPGIGQQDLSAFLGTAKPLRVMHEGVDSTPVYRFINVSHSQAVNNMDVLDLPLIKGDRFYL